MTDKITISPRKGELSAASQSRKYTEEDARLIVRGLVSGRRPGRRRTSNAEISWYFGPARDRQSQILAQIEGLVEQISEHRAHEKYRPVALKEPQAIPVVYPRSGAINL